MHYTAPMSLLSLLGRRVRRLRREREWTRADLSERSGISVRFLARIETGEGNVSIRRLEDLAVAFGTTPSELVREEPTAPGVVALVGLRGAGKSTIGSLLAARLRVPFVEIDERITETSGLSLDELFELHGEQYYRRLEHVALRQILDAGEPIVLAAAGGVVNEPASWRLLLDRARVVWLRAQPEDHWNRVVSQGDRRPMKDNPGAMEELRALLSAREPAYAGASITVETSGRDPEVVVRALTERLAS